MKNTLHAALALLVLFVAGCATNTARQATQPAYSPLILISIDGFRADYLDRGITPTLSALAADGIRAQAMRPSFPSLTFPNHYTLVTGLYPDHHGVVNNTMIDAKLGKFSISNREAGADGRWWDGGEPIWVTADKQGLRTGTMFWPGSEAEIHGRRPDYYLPFNGKLTADQRVDQVLAWMDLPPAERPQFLTLYFDQVDHQGHDHGPDSVEVNDAVRTTDTAIGRFVAELKKRNLYETANLVIVSDHGMANVAEDRTVFLDKLIDMQDVDLVTAGIVVGLNAKPGHEAQVEKALLAPHDHLSCWRKSEIPARLHYGTHPREPALLCVAEDGWDITTQAYFAKPNHKKSGGEHGYDNADPNMRALFVAHGPAFKQGLVVAEFENVNVYPLLAHVLGIAPAPNDGNLAVTRDMLRR